MFSYSYYVPYISYYFNRDIKVKFLHEIKIQPIFFNNQAEMRNKYLEQSQTYYIINSHISGLNPNFRLVYKELEIVFNNSTIFKDCNK